MWPGQSCLAIFIVCVIFADHKKRRICLKLYLSTGM
jgi:hypothetical protein